ncbi:NADPH-dependent 7-cyano-7-deazaguanine reductase QueF [Candidatus Marimicrobium litorale]|nr:NADPH-dependent 7-cyano-7-deazaguanine reductase QueF [Candidatus Marimicrobium litorale]
MEGDDSKGMLLGKVTPVVDVYSPELLHPMPRQFGRDSLLINGPLPFHGVDLWHAYELSWLNLEGKPEARVGRFTVPADSPNLVESKSLKLYLNSLNNMRFESEEAFSATVISDVGAVAGVSVSLELWGVNDQSISGAALAGDCIDSEACADPESGCAVSLRIDGDAWVEERLFSHLMRSLCPITGQPDWATLWLHYRGPRLDRGTLLQYIVSYRQHQEFHEQCAERIFLDIYHLLAPDFLHLQAFYTRRGGLDITPFRSSELDARAQGRIARQ